MIGLITGFCAGMLHVVSGPDHLAAIAPLAVKYHRRAWASGVRWGFGHAAGVAVVGLLALWLRDLLPINLISAWSERLVGVVLLAIGFWGLRNALNLHAHEHQHESERHLHVHIHPEAKPRPNHHKEGHFHTHTAFGIGTLHGLAGSSHFLGVLPAVAMGTKLAGAGYLLAYGLGTILAMGLFASGVGLLASNFALDRVKAFRGLLCACSIAAIAIGGFWLIA